MCAVPVMLTEQNRMSSLRCSADHLGVGEVGGVEADLPVGTHLAVEALDEGVVPEHVEQVGDVVGQQQVVVAQVEDRVAARGLDGVVAVALAVVRALGEIEEPDTLVGVDEVRDDGSDLVGDAVADEQHLEVSHALAQHGVDGEGQRGGLVVDGDQHGRAGHDAVLEGLVAQHQQHRRSASRR